MTLFTGLVSRHMMRTLLTVLPLLLIAPSAWAAGGEMPSLVHDIGLSLLAAGVLGVIFTRLKIPSIAAFLLAGIVDRPDRPEAGNRPENIDTIAQLGFILLLFLIGLEIDFKKILGSGKAIIISGLLQYPLTILFGVLAVKLMVCAGHWRQHAGGKPSCGHLHGRGHCRFIDLAGGEAVPGTL